jgi:hypothetical protein
MPRKWEVEKPSENIILGRQGGRKLELPGWSCGAGALGLELWGCSCGAGPVGLELWGWSSH